MDAKDLRIETALGVHTNDGSSKYGQSGAALQTNGNKPYHDIGSNTSTKIDMPTARPCAIIGPDRVLPPHATSDIYLKKVAVDPWPCPENVYQQPPEYPHKPTDYPPQRNISPRQTFQENMQRIMVPPTYSSVKNDDRNLKNSKSMPLEAKYCDVPYTISPINNEPKNMKNSEGLGPNNNPPYAQPVPQGWSGSGVSVRPLRPYGAPELYQYTEYPNCPAPRSISMIRPHRNVVEDVPQTYQDRFYHEANLRFKPYTTTKERPHQHPQARYDYIPNYPNTFHPHALYPPHKYDLQKSMPPHPYPVYPPVPLKYLDRRIPAPTMERYQRSPNQQINFNPPFCNQNIPPAYGPVPGNCMQNRPYPYSPDSSTKPVIQNRLYIDSSNSRKYYSNSENLYINDINRQQTIKNDVLYPTHPSLNIHSLPPHHMYRKESPMKGFEYATHYRNIEHTANMNALSRLPLQFSPQTISISPSDSNTSNDTIQALNNSQEDCGYVSQSSTASVRSVESGINRISSDMYRRNDLRYDTFSCVPNKSNQKLDVNSTSKDKKNLNVRQFLQTWNEGDDETNDNNKEVSIQKDSTNSMGCYEPGNNQEQLYVLGLVNVPNEELGKYDHIEKISKLPENIKGYNSIELLNQYEKLVESPGVNHFNLTPPQSKQKDLLVRNAIGRQGMEVQPRPISPLDVEAKISQSVIHKEVGCNFEIRPCSPQIMNVDVATPVHNVLNERLIEKVVNPVVKKSPMHHRIEDTNNDISSRNSPKVASCKMVNNQFPSPNISDTLKTNYCLHDMENNSGLCLASLPRLDNDIELNFPEINQQFINANKIDTLKTSTIRDLPILDTDNVGNTPKNKNNLPNKPLISEHLNSGFESDKEGSKLSKYRKHKRSSSVANEICNNSNQSISLHRTDSVIIKNPDNVKTCEEYANHISLISNNTDQDNAVNPINLIVEGDRVIDYSDQNFNESVNEKLDACPSKDICETAIDFSLNKSSDEQSTCIQTVNNLSDPLPNSENINKDTLLESETNTHNANKLGNIESPKQLDANSVPEEFPIIQSNSPTLGDFTCHDMINSTKVPDKEFLYKQINTDLLNKKTDLESLDEENLILKTDKEIVTAQLVSSLPEERKDSPILCFDLDTVSKTLISSNDITVTNSDINNDNTGDKILNCEEDPKDSTRVVTESDNNLLEAAEMDQNCVNIENNSSSDKDTLMNSTRNALNIDNVPSTVVHDDIKIDSCDVKNRNEFEIGALNAEINVSGMDTTEKKTILDYVAVTEKDIVTSKNYKQIEDTSCGTQSNVNVELTNVCSNECNGTETITNISKDDVTDTKVNYINDNIDQTKQYCTTSPNITDENDFKANLLSDFELSSIPSSETLTIFENNQLTDIINTKQEKENFIETEKEFDTSISNTHNNESTTNDNKTAILYKTKSFCKKELFSPWIQYLFLHNEGFCISQKSDLIDNTSEVVNIPHGNNNDLNYGEINLKSNEKEKVEQVINFPNNSVVIDQNPDENSFNFVADYEGNTSDLEHTNNKNADVTHENIEESNGNNNTHLFNELMSNEMATEESKESENRNDIDADAEIHERTVTQNTKENVNPDTCTVENHIVESSLELTVDPTDEFETTGEKDNQNNIKFYDYFKEITCLNEHLPRNPIPGRRSRTLKRSLSDSAAMEYNNSASIRENHENNYLYSNKRTKLDDSEILVESQMLAENFTSFIQNNRRNSISTIYNDENVSFCILIDNDCVLTDENEECQKICYTEIPTDCLATICTEAETVNTDINQVTSYEDSGQCEYDNELIVQNAENNPIEESWVEDVACMETVFSDDIAEDIEINAPSSPKDSCTSEDENDTLDYLYNVNKNEHTNKIKYIYGNQMCDDDAQLVEKLYRTPQMDVNKTLIDRESQIADDYNRYYDNESLEKILSESNNFDSLPFIQNDIVPDNSLILPDNGINDIHGNKENSKATFSEQETRNEPYGNDDLHNQVEREKNDQRKSKDDILVHSCESSCDISYRKDEEKLNYAISSSPEVSSTTSEEKSSGILLKIRSYKGTKISEINEMGASFNCTHNQSFNNSNYGLSTSRPLITKAAQKYIPPLKETIRDLKVKLHLPKQSLYKLQQLKKSKEQPKIVSHTKHYPKNYAQENPKKTKPKPKFEDVLKSIDEIQFKMHKEKHRKSKQSIPKVIIKKNENGAHYASTKTKETFNPDLTGRKWQPWVFLEKSNFIDKMALKQKFKAIYNHRKKTYVLAESFRKYKSVNNSKPSFHDSRPNLITNSKFVISHPKTSNNVSSGKLKYTFKLKHN